jgi:hypothetical protein
LRGSPPLFSAFCIPPVPTDTALPPSRNPRN